MALPSPEEIDAMMAAEGDYGGSSLPSPEEIDAMMAAEAPAAEVSKPFSWGDSAKFVGKSLVQGAAKTGDLLSLFGSGTSSSAISDLFSGRPGALTRAADATVGDPFDMGNGWKAEGTAAKLTNAAVEGSVFPVGGPIANAIVSAGAEAAHEINPESKWAPLAGAVGTTALLGTGRGIANTALSMGKAFERGSLSANTADYLRSLAKRGQIPDEEIGQIGSRISQAINEIGDTEGFGLLRTPQRLAARNEAVLKTTGKAIGDTLNAADVTGVNPLVDLTSANSVTQKLINSSTANKTELKEAFNEFLGRITHPQDGWDGTVKGLNEWKSAVAGVGYSGTAKGTLPVAMARKLNRAIATDLGMAVDNAVVESGVISPDDWGRMLRKYSNHAEIAPVVNPEIAKSLSSTPDKVARAMLKTSGGTITTPVLIGSALAGAAGGPAAGVIAAMGLSALSSPTGRGIAGNVLKAAGRAGKAAIPKPSLLAAVDKGVDRSMISEIFSSPAAKELPMTEKAPSDPMTEIKSDPYLHALGLTESGLKPEAKNKDSSAKGIFQLIDSTAKALGVSNPHDVGQSLAGIKKLTEEHRARFGDNPAMLYAAHFLGATLLQKVIDRKPLTDKEKKHVEELKMVALPNFEKNYNKVTA